MIDLQFIGGGKMAEALIGGVLASESMAPGQIAVVEVSSARRDYLEKTFPGISVLSEPVAAHGVVLATKPAHVTTAIASAVAAGVERVLSIAAGISTEALEAAISSQLPIIRVMPNTPALVGAGASVMSAGSFASEADLEWASSILSAVGIVEVVDEAHMDAVTGLSGSGPAYIFMVSEALIEAGVLNGLPRDISERLAHQTILGAGQLLTDSDDGAAALRAAVTSPGGTTAAGLHALETRSVRAAFVEAVSAAAERSGELG